MERTPVSSSQILSVGYDPESRVLEVEFKRKGEAPGGVYDYFDVEPEQHQAFMEAESLGKHFGTSIRGKYRFAKVVPEPPAEAAKGVDA
jgi:KTSC domain